jgi:cytochrome P450
VPKDCSAIIFTYSLHRDEKYFPEPEKFNPERFLDIEKMASWHPYAYIPFSAGNRSCVGQKLAMLKEKIILASLLRKFEIVSAAQNIKPVIELVLRPDKDIFVEFKSRQ